MLKVMAVSDPPVNSAYPGRVRVEAATMGEAMEERYSMCQDQPAQIDCRVEACIFYFGGHCAKALPAITLNPDKSYVCWSEKTLEELDIERQSRKAEEETMKVTAVNEYLVLEVKTDDRESPQYRRYTAKSFDRYLTDWWEIYLDGAWEGVIVPELVRTLENAYQKFVQGEGSDPAPEWEWKLVKTLENATQWPRVYRRCSPGVWEARLVGHSVCENVDDPTLLAELEKTYQNSMPEEAVGSTLKDPGQRYTDDFEWKASPELEIAQAHEMLAYLAGIGKVLHPWWAWTAFDTTYQSQAYFQRDLWGLKVRQWRGPGFSNFGLLTDGGKYGVILVLPEEELVRLWHKSPDQKLAFARQITRETIEHARPIEEGAVYTEYASTIFEVAASR